jgi:[acyl-carrier-protein] S-malonyltransferase
MTAVLRDAQLRIPRMPVITNVAAVPVDDPDTLRQHLVEQITRPVRWTESIRQLNRLGVQIALEVGPGSVLKGLVRRIVPSLKMFSAGSGEDISAAITAIEQEH